MNYLYRRVSGCVLVATLGLSGCAHQIAFQDARYSIQSKRYDASIVAVIDQDTLHNTVSIRSFMTGIAQSWDAEPGLMLKQVADIELPQMFDQYRFASSYEEPKGSGRRVILEMTIPSYQFADFHATITVRAIAYAPGKHVLFDRTYTDAGVTEGSKMFWAGAFGMQSAVRTSSLDAFKKIFTSIRGDLKDALRTAGTASVSSAAANSGVP